MAFGGAYKAGHQEAIRGRDFCYRQRSRRGPPDYRGRDKHGDAVGLASVSTPGRDAAARPDAFGFAKGRTRLRPRVVEGFQISHKGRGGVRASGPRAEDTRASTSTGASLPALPDRGGE